MIARSRERLEEMIDEFSVMEQDGKIIGCIAVHALDESSVEIVSVVMHGDYRSGERGANLLKFAEQSAKHKGKYKGKSRLFAMTAAPCIGLLSMDLARPPQTIYPASGSNNGKMGEIPRCLLGRACLLYLQ